jgi:hypothetical protein
LRPVCAKPVGAQKDRREGESTLRERYAASRSEQNNLPGSR